MEFHISRKARDLYQFDESLFSLSGNVIFLNFHAARLFAQRMNEKKDLINFPNQAVKAGQINAMGLIDEILHYVVGLYRVEKNPEVMSTTPNYHDVTREKLRQLLRSGKLDERVVELETSSRNLPVIEVLSATGIEEMEFNIKEMFGNMFPKKTKKQKVN